MAEDGLSDSFVEGLKEVSHEAVKAYHASPASPTGDDGLEQRQVAHEKFKKWATTARDVLIRTNSYFRLSRGESINEQSIRILVELLRQLRDDYLRHIIRQESELTRYDPGYQGAAELKQEEQFWNSWQPLFRLANAYYRGALEQPPPGVTRVKFELKKGDLSSDIRQKLDSFTKQFVGVLDAFLELPPPP